MISNQLKVDGRLEIMNNNVCIQFKSPYIGKSTVYEYFLKMTLRIFYHDASASPNNRA